MNKGTIYHISYVDATEQEPWGISTLRGCIADAINGPSPLPLPLIVLVTQEQLDEIVGDLEKGSSDKLYGVPVRVCTGSVEESVAAFDKEMYDFHARMKQARVSV